jgi:single-strand DNA-binding protein
MANLNKVLLMGNLTKDPVLRYLPSQTAVCDFGIAVNRTWTGQDGIKKEEVTFVDLEAFGKTAELLAKYKKKGDPLFIEGRLKLDQWEKDGIKHSRMKVIVENFQFLNRGQPGGYGAPAAAAEPGEYAGEPAPAPQQPAYPQRQAYRPAGRPGMAPPAARPAPTAPAAPATPNYDAGDAPPPPEDGAQIAQDDIPF